MKAALNRPVSGHVYRVERKRGPVWFAKYRLPDGRQVQKKIGPAWTGRGRPAAGYLTKSMAREFTPEFFERWKGDFGSRRRLSNRTLQKYLVALHSIFKRAMKVHGLPRNPLTTVERPRLPRRAGVDVFSRREVMALVKAASNDQDRVLYLTAAFTGLRLGELLGLRWEDVDFIAATIRVRRTWGGGVEGTPKSGRDRAVPMMDEVAQALLGHRRRRERFVGHQDLVFCDPLGGHLGYDGLSQRYKNSLDTAGLRRLRFHDLRHTFGSHAIRAADPREVMEWMGHADIQTTQKYLSYKPRRDAARRLATAFDDEDLAAI